MCKFPSKKLLMKGSMPPEKVMRMLDDALKGASGGTPPKFTGNVSGNDFTIKNRSKMPAIVTGHVAGTADGGATAEVIIRQDPRMTMGEAVFLVIVLFTTPALFPDLATQAGLWVPGLLMLILYYVAFQSEVTQAQDFLHKAWDEKRVSN